MKKIWGMVLLCILMLGLSACGGNTENIKTHEVDSEMYSQEDISSAIEVIKKDFKSSVWKGCTLTEIYYQTRKINCRIFYRCRNRNGDILFIFPRLINQSDSHSCWNDNDRYRVV